MRLAVTGLIAPALVSLGLALAGCSPAEITAGGKNGTTGSGGAGNRSGSAGNGGSTGSDSGGANGSGFLNLDGGFPDTGPMVAPPMQGENCATEAQNAKILPLDILVLVDTSRSMQEKSPSGRTKWEMGRAALAAFVNDPKSAGLGAGLQFFPVLPYQTCANDAACGDRGGFINEEGDACFVNTVCVGPDTKLTSAQSCGLASDDEVPTCPAGLECVPLGRCSKSGGDCLRAGEICPSGMAGDTCQLRGKTCQYQESVRGSCMPADQKLVVPIADLPGVAPAFVAALDTKLPFGATPLQPGASASYEHLRMRLATNPNRRAALVVLTDGVPNTCSTTNGLIQLVTRARQGTPSLPTYIIGVFGEVESRSARTLLEGLATAGGTGMPFVLSPTDDLTQKLTEALNQIRGAALSCEIGIPKPTMGQIDFNKVNVRVTAGGKSTDLVYVGAAGRCDMARGGWYYDTDPAIATPTRVLLCDASCKGLLADEMGAVELVFGCRTRIVE